MKIQIVVPTLAVVIMLFGGTVIRSENSIAEGRPVRLAMAGQAGALPDAVPDLVVRAASCTTICKSKQTTCSRNYRGQADAFCAEKYNECLRTTSCGGLKSAFDACALPGISCLPRYGLMDPPKRRCLELAPNTCTAKQKLQHTCRRACLRWSWKP